MIVSKKYKRDDWFSVTTSKPKRLSDPYYSNTYIFDFLNHRLYGPSFKNFIWAVNAKLFSKFKPRR